MVEVINTSDPHDHKINWESPRKGVPNFEKTHTNYWNDEYPDIALTNGAQEKICDTPDDVLDYRVGEYRLRDVITQVTVLHRNI